MKKTMLFITTFLILSCSTAKAQADVKQISFPKDFTLPVNEIPNGYVLRPIDEEARASGLSANPGFIVNDGFIKGIYDNVDLNAVEKVFIGMYQPKSDKDFEMGYYVIAYTSEKALDKEQQKIRKYSGAHYFTKGRYLLEVWGDGGSFEEAVTHISNYFKNTLSLKEFTPKESEVATDSTGVIDVATPASE